MFQSCCVLIVFPSCLCVCTIPFVDNKWLTRPATHSPKLAHSPRHRLKELHIVKKTIRRSCPVLPFLWTGCRYRRVCEHHCLRPTQPAHVLHMRRPAATYTRAQTHTPKEVSLEPGLNANAEAFQDGKCLHGQECNAVAVQPPHTSIVA